MHFGMKSTLKSNRNHTPKQTSYYFNPKKKLQKKTHIMNIVITLFMVLNNLKRLKNLKLAQT
jgi:hypothetical protein